MYCSRSAKQRLITLRLEHQYPEARALAHTLLFWAQLFKPWQLSQLNTGPAILVYPTFGSLRPLFQSRLLGDSPLFTLWNSSIVFLVLQFNYWTSPISGRKSSLSTGPLSSSWHFRTWSCLLLSVVSSSKLWVWGPSITADSSEVFCHLLSAVIIPGLTTTGFCLIFMHPLCLLYAWKRPVLGKDYLREVFYWSPRLAH